MSIPLTGNIYVALASTLLSSSPDLGVSLYAPFASCSAVRPSGMSVGDIAAVPEPPCAAAVHGKAAKSITKASNAAVSL